MKKMKYASGVIAAGAALAASCLVGGCDNKKPEVVSGGPKPAVASPSVGGITVLKPAEPNGFERTVSMLDVGGPFLMYFSTAQILNNLSADLESWKPTIAAAQKDDPDAKQKTDQIFGLLSNVVKKSGIEQLDGIGASVFPVEAGLTRSKGFIQHPKSDLSKTLIWNLFGTKAHALDEIKLLPSNTTFAYFQDFDLGFLWNFIQTEAKGIPEPEIAEGIAGFPQQFEGGTGLKWDDTLASLGNNYGVVVTLDPAKKIQIPGVNTEIGEPAIALVIKTKNDLIFKKLDEVLTQMGQNLPPITKTDEGGISIRTTTIPKNPNLDMEVSPTIAQTKDYLIISSSKALTQAMLDSFSGKAPGLAATSDEFKRLRANTPEEGNAFSFVSKEFGTVVTQIQKAAASNDKSMPPEVMDKFLSLYMSPATFSVSTHLEDGWYGVTNSGASYGTLIQPVRSLPGLIMMSVIIADANKPPKIDFEDEEPVTTEPAQAEPMDSN